MGCIFPHNLTSNEYYLNKNTIETIRKTQLNIKNLEYKNEINITQNTEKKEFNQNIDFMNKKAIDIIYSYNNKSTKISSDNSNIINTILLKLYNSSNLLIDEIELTSDKIISKYNHYTKTFDKSKKISFGSNISNDYIIKDNSISPIQFYIYYNESKKKFCIMDNLSGTGTFIKLTKEIIIKENMIVGFCVDFMYFDVKVLRNGETQLKINFLQKSKNSEKNSEIIFDSNEYKNFTIGRSNKCNYKYDDESVSKVQCTLCYEKENWYLYDGSITVYERKHSTNGLWLLCRKGICLENQMIIKTGDFKIFVVEE